MNGFIRATNVRIYFVRDHHLLQEIIARKIGTEYNVSDTMTKCLAVDAFNKHKQILLYGHMPFDQWCDGRNVGHFGLSVANLRSSKKTEKKSLKKMLSQQHL